MNKVLCIRCRASILEATAKENEGLCVPCKTGTRELFEAARRWRKEQREREIADPLSNLWQILVRRVHESSDGFASLSEPEKHYYSVGLVVGEVFNGGFEQYFTNSSADYYKYATAGLAAMGASQSLTLLQRAKQVLFGFQRVPENIEARWRLLEQRVSVSLIRRLNELDAAYLKDPDGLTSRALAFARKHGLV